MPQCRLALALALLPLLLASCGKFQEKFGRLPEGQTRLNIATQQSPTATGTMSSGMIIYIYSTDANGFATTITKSDETQAIAPLSVPNGVYKIIGLGWDGTYPLQLTNPIRCAQANGGLPIALTGGGTTVTLTFTNANCDFANAAGNNFYPPNHSGSYAYSLSTSFKAPTLNLCSTTGTSGTLGASMTCASPSSTYGSKFVTITLVGYVKNGGVIQELGSSANLVSQCGSMSGGTSSMGVIPFGNPNMPSPFYTRVSIFSGGDSTCVTTPELILNFTEGIGKTSIPSAPTVIFAPGTGNSNFLVNVGS